MKKFKHLEKLGLILLFFSFFQLVLVGIAFQFQWLYKLQLGFGGADLGFSPIVQELLVSVLVVEFIISLFLILNSLFFNDTNDK